MGKARVIAVANSKGGTGKTTTAVNLAAELARAQIGAGGEVRGRVLIIDLDPQGHVANALGLSRHKWDYDTNPMGSCVSFLISGERLMSKREDRNTLIVPADRSREGLPRPNLFAILATPRLNLIVPQLDVNDYMARRNPTLARGHVFLEQALGGRMGAFTDAFDYVLIDCPPNLGVYATMVYNYADEVIVPVRADDLSVDGLVRHLEELAREREKGARAGLSYVLPTMVRPRQRIDQFAVNRMRETFGDRVADPILDLVAVKEAPGVGGRTLLEYDPESPAALAYRSLAQRIQRGR